MIVIVVNSHPVISSLTTGTPVPGAVLGTQ